MGISTNLAVAVSSSRWVLLKGVKQSKTLAFQEFAISSDSAGTLVLILSPTASLSSPPSTFHAAAVVTFPERKPHHVTA